MDYKCRLKVILAEREIKHGDFAKVIGISTGALSSIVNNNSFPSFKVVYRISEELDLDIRKIWIKK
ncbi:transcriptional regulator [Niallia nealsonii]|uniref:Transcriptional regulator n=2 Tax=Niallia nealsonii TaxID=115979 RepID=A0A2N0YYM7_9BACI|nr:helix-turn-helix transcriptional regulator [Niallia nealsonii]PKG22367.1 transcriptional regulator [Niallia nealsonii]